MIKLSEPYRSAVKYTIGQFKAYRYLYVDRRTKSACLDGIINVYLHDSHAKPTSGTYDILDRLRRMIGIQP